MSLINQMLNDIEKARQEGGSEKPLDTYQPPPPPLPEKRHWSCMAGWGVALVVGLVSAPAIRDYWFVEKTVALPSAKVGQGLLVSGVQKTKPKPKHEDVVKNNVFQGSLPPHQDPNWPLISEEQGHASLLPSNPPVLEKKPLQEESIPHVSSTIEKVQPVISVAKPVISKPVEEAAKTISVAKPVISKPVEEVAKTISVAKPVISKPVEEVAKTISVAKPVISKPAEEVAKTISVAKPVISKPVEEVAKTISVAKPVISKPAEEVAKTISVAKPVISKPVEERSKPVISVPLEKVSKPTPVFKPVVSTLETKPHQASPAAVDPKLISSLFHHGKKPIPMKLDFKYTIQVGAFLERDGALRRASELRSKGYDAYILELWGIKDPSRLWQSVRVGRFNDLDRARIGVNYYKSVENPNSYIALSDTFAGPSIESEKKTTTATGEDNKGERPHLKPSVALLQRQDAKEMKSEEKVHKVATTIPIVGHPEANKNQHSEKSTKVGADSKPVLVSTVVVQPKEKSVSTEFTQKSVSSESSQEKSVSIESTQKLVSSESSQEKPVITESTQEKPISTESTQEKPISTESSQEKPISTESTQEKPVSTESIHENQVSTDASERVEIKPEKSADQIFQEARLYRNKTLRKKSDLMAEERLLRQVLKKDPTHGVARNRLARLLVESGRSGEGLQVLVEVVGDRSSAELVKEEPNLAAFLAALYQREEKHWQAISLYEALLHRYPNKGIWRMGMAISLEKVKENQEALGAYQMAINSGDLGGKLRQFVQNRIDMLK